MSETTTNNPNVIQDGELERQAEIVIGEIMDSPQRIGANAEDGSYSKTETEHGVSENIDIGEHAGLKLRVTRQREHDPERHLPGKTSEGMSAYASIPDTAQVLIVLLDGKIQAIEYRDPFGVKNDMTSLKDAIDAIKLAVEELESLRA